MTNHHCIRSLLDLDKEYRNRAFFIRKAILLDSKPTNMPPRVDNEELLVGSVFIGFSRYGWLLVTSS